MRGGGWLGRSPRSSRRLSLPSAAGQGSRWSSRSRVTGGDCRSPARAASRCRCPRPPSASGAPRTSRRSGHAASACSASAGRRRRSVASEATTLEARIEAKITTLLDNLDTQDGEGKPILTAAQQLTALTLALKYLSFKRRMEDDGG